MTPTTVRHDVIVPMSDETQRALVRAGRNFDKWREERKRLIIQAHREGASLREIGIRAGLTHVAVMKILRDADIPADPYE